MFCTPASTRSPEYAESAVAMCYMRYGETKRWDKTVNTVSNKNNRGEDYEEFKIRKSESVLNKLEKKYSGIRNKVKAYYSSTPLTYRDYIGNSDGSMYGIVRESANPMKTFIASRTKIPNLLLTGQNVHLGHGVLGVTIGAMLTCSEILGLDYMLKQIRNTN
jgi:all-trans-retinol 13,14-reductase